MDVTGRSVRESAVPLLRVLLRRVVEEARDQRLPDLVVVFACGHACCVCVCVCVCVFVCVREFIWGGGGGCLGDMTNMTLVREADLRT